MNNLQILHVLRNPHGWNDHVVRDARLAAADRLEQLLGLVVMRFDMERVPQFSQGYQDHEVLEPVTAAQCTWMVSEIERLQTDNAAQARQAGNFLEEIAKLRAELAAAYLEMCKVRVTAIYDRDVWTRARAAGDQKCPG